MLGVQVKTGTTDTNLNSGYNPIFPKQRFSNIWVPRRGMDWSRAGWGFVQGKLRFMVRFMFRFRFRLRMWDVDTWSLAPARTLYRLWWREEGGRGGRVLGGGRGCVLGG